MIEPITAVVAGLALAGSYVAVRAVRRRRLRRPGPTLLDESRQHLKELKGLTSKILNARMNAKMRALCDRAEKIVKMMEKEPSRYSGGKALVNYVIETSCRVAKSYADLAPVGETKIEAGSTLQKLEDSVRLLEDAFDKQLQKAMEKDIINIDVELEMLKKTLKMEGL